MPKKTKYFMAGILMLSLVAGWVVGVLFPRAVNLLFDNKDSNKAYHLADGTTIAREDRMVILLLGIDARKGEKETRTDSMIVAVVDKPNKVVSLLSVPRDTRVRIPGHGYQKINSANVYGGPKMAEKAVENLLGIPIDYYVKTNFNGFKQIVDALGGVHINVEKNFVCGYGKKLRFTKGEHFLSGDEALQYARFRHDAMGDVGRTQRQQKVLIAIAREALQAKNILRLPKLIPAFKKAVDTDMPMSDMLALARIGKGINPDKIATQTLPGNFLNYKGVSYWFVDENQSKEVAMNMLKGKDGAPIINVALKKKIDELKGSSSGTKTKSSPYYKAEAGESKSKPATSTYKIQTTSSTKTTVKTTKPTETTNKTPTPPPTDTTTPTQNNTNTSSGDNSTPTDNNNTGGSTTTPSSGGSTTPSTGGTTTTPPSTGSQSVPTSPPTTPPDQTQQPPATQAQTTGQTSQG